MKYFLSILLFFAYKITIIAQTTMLPMVVDGRTWKIVSIIPSEPPEIDNVSGYYKDIKGRWGIGVPHVYMLEGDTIMGNVVYKKLFLDNTFISGLREENGRIYECYWNGVPECMIFDIHLQTGDLFKDTTDELNQMKVKNTDEIIIGGKKRRYLEMWIYSEGQEIIDGLVDYWIEGIGCMNGPHSPFWWTAVSNQVLLLSCNDGDDCVFTAEEFLDVSTLIRNPTIESRPCSISYDNLYYDLQGRCLTGKPTKGLYIQNGKKVIVK